MWFIKATGRFENGMSLPVIADLSGEHIYPTAFFNHFSNAPVYNMLTIAIPDVLENSAEVLSILLEEDAISEKEREEDFTTA